MSERKWRPIPARDRRVLGVLVEKAKTVPDQYPLSLNALVTGCNQKNNRFPLMTLEANDVEDAIDRLKQVGAVVEVQGSSRVARFKHLLYEWLGVDKVELAVMAELLLRGAQTEGELRGRASRMEPIADMSALRPVLESLREKGLIISLSPPGRGHVLTHALYEERELEKVRNEYQAMGGGESSSSRGEGGGSSAAASSTYREPAASYASSATASAPAGGHASAVSSEEIAELRQAINELRMENSELRESLTRLRQEFDLLADSLR